MQRGDKTRGGRGSRCILGGDIPYFVFVGGGERRLRGKGANKINKQIKKEGKEKERWEFLDGSKSTHLYLGDLLFSWIVKLAKEGEGQKRFLCSVLVLWRGGKPNSE